MEPYYSCKQGDLYLRDCLEVMPNLGVKVDVVITDPPYGTSACSWDNIINLQALWSTLTLIKSTNCPIIFFGVEPFSSILRMSNLKEYKYDWKWQKSNAANFLNFKYQPAKVIEDILVFGDKPTSYSKNENLKYFPIMEVSKAYTQKSGKQKQDYGNSSVRTPIEQRVTENKGERYPKNILSFNKDKDKFHPTQKPVALLEYLIRTYSNPNELILDFTCGSGTTGVAAINTGRRFILIEKEEKYCEITVKRLEEAISKQNEKWEGV